MDTPFPNFGALVISLDFELSWGVKDFLASNPGYMSNIAGEYSAVKAILRLFEEFEVSATWATVGLIFAESEEDAVAYSPSVLPTYKNQELSPFGQMMVPKGDRKHWFAPELVEQIRLSPRQEVATHTFSHFYCLEDGQTAESFAADIDSALAIAKKNNVDLKSIVFPRNQHNPDYDALLFARGITCYRGNQKARMYQFDGDTQTNPFLRFTRLLDTYLSVSGPNTFEWTDMKKGDMVNVPASIFLRPVRRSSGVLEDLQLKRIEKSMENAARSHKVFHLWWHPHNFGTNLEANLAFLRRILSIYRRLEQQYGMQSMSMSGAARLASAIG